MPGRDKIFWLVERVMFNIAGAVKFGLNVRNQDQQKVVKKNVLGDDSDDDDNRKPMTHGEIVKQQLEMQRKRVEEQMEQKERELTLKDPTALDYDEVYEHLKKEDEKYQEKKRLKQSIRGKPKYVEKLIQEAEKRKRQNDVWYEKKLQREQEAEKEAYGETEKFVTPTYKKHLEELKKFEEEQRKEEERNAVTNKGMKGFYTNLLGLGKSSTNVKEEEKKEDEQQKQASNNEREGVGEKEPDEVKDNVEERGSMEPPQKKLHTTVNLANPLGIKDSKVEETRRKELEELNRSKLQEDKVAEARRRYLERKKNKE